MATTFLAPVATPRFEPVDVVRLMTRFEGRVIRSGSIAYDAARRVWNGMIDRHPALIVRPANVEDVRRAVIFARERDLSLSIKGGGHNVAGHAVAEGGLMLDLSAMRRVRVDSLARVARVEGGATWADFDEATAAAGLATTGGVISSTGVGGLTLGGGIGWLVGKHGMSIDNLLAAEVVTADGTTVRASRSEHPDLFWALRGGGGNFGVVTAFEFLLHPLTEVLAGVVVYPAAQSREVLEFYRELTAAGSKPDELGIYCSLIPDPETGARVIAVIVCWSGDLAEGERVLAPLRRFGSPLLTAIEPVPYPIWQRTFDEAHPHGRRYYWKGNLLRDLPDGLIEALAELAADPPLPQVSTHLEGYGGAINRVGSGETAYPHRGARYQLVITGGWDDPADDERGRTWVRELHAATPRPVPTV
jgi:FAD/FMN-containing dehydrogenase